MIDFNMAETGLRIKKLRLDLGLSQAALAEMVGVKQHTITQYEKGIVKLSLDVLVNMAVALNSTTDYLLGL